jgi:nitroreductase
VAQQVSFGLSAKTVREWIQAAVAAPSVYNTQPWRFHARRDRIDVFADRSRRLDVIDPRGRELLLSVGAAILNLRVAILASGRLVMTTLLGSDEPDFAARIALGPPAAPSHTVRALAEAVPKRRTNRAPYARTAIPIDVVEQLRAAASAEGAELFMLDPVRRNAVLALAFDALRLEEDPRYLDELAAWTASAPARRDGITPASAAYRDVTGRMPLRDFGAAFPPERVRPVPFEPHPHLAILSTRGDGPRQWLRAGQAMQRVLLTATVHSLSAQPLTQPLEVSALRQALGRPDRGTFAHVLVRLGYGPPVGAVAPRRAIEDVLLIS